MAELLNYKPGMEYRRFGKTDKQISVITLGGMRYIHGWDEPREELPNDSVAQCLKMVDMSINCGINHIETAYGYKKSERLYGVVLNNMLKVPRKNYYLMTKAYPKTAEDTKVIVEKQLNALKTDYFDFYGWHGMNNLELFKTACKSGGPVEELLKFKEQGVIKHVGFSTHAPLEVIIKAIETDLFEFINLHYYYVFQRNLGAIALAESKDMGVFIISPNDKGGQLFSPPEKFKKITFPATPIQWNARFCLSNPAIHTLSFGMTEPSHIQEMLGIFPTSMPLSKTDHNIWLELEKQKLLDPYSTYLGYNLQNDPSGINIPEILRLRMLWKCFDMLDFGRYRYNDFEGEGHWLPGHFPTEENLKKLDVSKFLENIPVLDLIKETHKALYKPKKK